MTKYTITQITPDRYDASIEIDAATPGDAHVAARKWVRECQWPSADGAPYHVPVEIECIDGRLWEVDVQVATLQVD